MPQTVIPDNEGDLFDSAETQVADYLDIWQDGVRRTQKMNSTFTDSFADMARDVTGYFGNLVKSIKDGDFFSIVDGVLGLLDSIGRATGGFKIGGMQFGGGVADNSVGIPGFANGGAMKLGGFAGIDRNMLSMNGRPLARVSRGETMQIRPENDTGGSGARPVAMQFDLRGAVVTDDLLRQMNNMANAAAVRGAQGGAKLASAQMMRMRQKSLA
jgi:hypothetical protein